MTCAHCRDAGEFFDDGPARRELRRYRKKGPTGTTALILEALRSRGLPEGWTLLDIGGGVGALQHEVLDEGAGKAVGVDASEAYLRIVREEAERRGHAERVSTHLGDFVELADSISAASAVTLDRVVCCYPDMPGLVGASADRAERLYALAFPRERWWIRAGVRVLNLWFRLRGSAFRVFVHPSCKVVEELGSRGFRRYFFRTTFLWQVMAFERVGSRPDG